MPIWSHNNEHEKKKKENPKTLVETLARSIHEFQGWGVGGRGASLLCNLRGERYHSKFPTIRSHINEKPKTKSLKNYKRIKIL